MGRGADHVTGSSQNHIIICHSTKHLGICRLDWVSENCVVKPVRYYHLDCPVESITEFIH